MFGAAGREGAAKCGAGRMAGADERAIAGGCDMADGAGRAIAGGGATGRAAGAPEGALAGPGLPGCPNASDSMQAKASMNVTKPMLRESMTALHHDGRPCNLTRELGNRFIRRSNDIAAPRADNLRPVRLTGDHRSAFDPKQTLEPSKLPERIN